MALLILGATWRLRVTGWEHVAAAIAARTPLVMITWHGRMMVPVWHCRHRGIVAMISRHRDGELVARMVERLGYETVRGSSTRGGTTAALELLNRIKAGRIAAMICDGPRGPIYKMKPGAAFLALQTKASVIPVSASADRAWIFKSWDRFMVPKPFARVTLLYGQSLDLAGDTDLKSATRLLEDALNAQLRRADHIAGRGPLSLN